MELIWFFLNSPRTKKGSPQYNKLYVGMPKPSIFSETFCVSTPKGVHVSHALRLPQYEGTVPGSSGLTGMIRGEGILWEMMWRLHEDHDTAQVWKKTRSPLISEKNGWHMAKFHHPIPQISPVHWPFRHYVGTLVSFGRALVLAGDGDPCLPLRSLRLQAPWIKWYRRFPKMGVLVPRNGWFRVDNPMNMDDLRVPQF